MLDDEKQELLQLLERASCWCQHVEAQDAGGDPVHCDAHSAVSWDITGAILRLFGRDRAATLYVQLDRHIHGARRMGTWPLPNFQLDAMLALQEFNDRADTTFACMRTHLESAPVWSGKRKLSGPALVD